VRAHLHQLLADRDAERPHISNIVSSQHPRTRHLAPIKDVLVPVLSPTWKLYLILPFFMPLLCCVISL